MQATIHEAGDKGDIMRKVAIIGSGGAGKSTLAEQIGVILNLPVHHLDALFWKPDWELVSKEEQTKVQERLLQKESWICDGNYNRTMELRFQAADTIIFLDLPRSVCLYRVLKRQMHYFNRTRPSMGEGCKERISPAFLKWVWQYPRHKRPHVVARLEPLSFEKKVLILSSRKEVERFVKDLEFEHGS